ncbi:hypothetical protein [Streptomyces sp. NPDC002580]|uniref:hypothetical protein n=1 Tax=Streptomyces sp. NPDC002580 TaxID=3364653 RepID=UPI0036CAC129
MAKKKLTPHQASTAPVPEPFLSLHTTVVLLAALVLGAIVGALSAMTGAVPAADTLAGLGAAGVCVPVLNTLIGKGKGH